jgi:hypothetical protein
LKSINKKIEEKRREREAEDRLRRINVGERQWRMEGGKGKEGKIQREERED